MVFGVSLGTPHTASKNVGYDWQLGKAGLLKKQKSPAAGSPWCRPSPRVTRRQDKLIVAKVRAKPPRQEGDCKFL
jgi:hypothetical protein